jgi:hypothetical protein
MASLRINLSFTIYDRIILRQKNDRINDAYPMPVFTLDATLVLGFLSMCAIITPLQNKAFVPFQIYMTFQELNLFE